MRKFAISGILAVIGTSAVARAAPLPLQGSDTLEDVTKDVIGVCSLGTLINYVGGGSGTGQAAMVAGTQQLAPMSRELNGTACTSSASQLLIGLDGIAIVAANQFVGDSTDRTPDDADDDCSDSIAGGVSISVPGCGAADGCTTPGTYTFTNWKDVLALIYGGQNHTTAPQLLTGNVRNPARINCAGIVRQALVNNWNQIFADQGDAAHSCRSYQCLKLKHAFRRGDLSGTTDTFLSLVGLVPIPPYTTTFANNLPTKDSAAAVNPFCNAGEAVMNKGDSDYLDLDPIRRIADSDSALNQRLGLEQVAEGYQSPSNPPTTLFVDNRADPAVTVLADYAVSNAQNIIPDPTIANSVNLQRTALAARKGLGVVLPIEIPTNYGDEIVAYFSTVPQGGEPTLCAPGAFALTNVGSGVMCPDGSVSPCLLPVNTTNPSVPNFNCLTNSPVPAASPLKDARVYNLWVVSALGKFVKDGYTNPNLLNAGLSAVRQNRIVSAFYRLHVSQVDMLADLAPGINCKKFSATDQIGCLVSANPCSIGFAGREAVDDFTNMAVQMENIKSTPATISNLVNGSGNPPYPLARRLWLNALNGFGTVTGDQRTLLQCFQGLRPGVPLDLIDSIVAGRNFVSVPAGVARNKTCPATFP